MAFHHSPKIITDGLVLSLDAGDKNSYPGSGTTWTSLVNTNHTGSMSNLSFTGNSIDFPGSSNSRCSWSNFTSTAQSMSTGTLSFWFQYDNASGNRYMVSMGDKTTNWNANKFHLSMMAAGDWFWGSYGAASRENVNVGTVLSTGNIYNITINSDGKLYLNGSLDFTADDAFWFNNCQTVTYFHFGQQYHGGGLLDAQLFDGDLYNLYIYDRALSAAEILQNFNAHRHRFGV